MADAERGLAARAPDGRGLPGCEFFYEHVHLNFDGNYAVAAMVFEQVVRAIEADEARQAAILARIPSRPACAERLALTGWR